MATTYREGDPFPGRIGRTLADSEPAWSRPPQARDGAPNVLLIALDDVGYAQLGCFGSDIETPALDALAAEGLRYRQFHTTAMCSPTRAAMLTGRNPHTCGIGGITELSSGFPGYAGRLDPRCALVSEVLRQQGWATMAIGKWHLAPADEQHAAAPRDRWPLGQGFERYYGFIGPETSQWAPELVIDNTPQVPVELDGEHLSELLADALISSIDDLRVADPVKPFFCYLALGAGHAPHHVGPEWIERYSGRFDDGWDALRERVHGRQLASGIVPPGTALSARPPWVPAWADLDDDARRVAARMMEVYAAFITHADHQIGRVLDHLRSTGELDRTLVVALSDNGASAEGGPSGTFNGAYLYNGMPHDAVATLERLDELGGPNSFPNYPWGWAFAGNTPFRRWKRETHEGGIGDPLVVKPPAPLAGDDAGAVRSQYVHAVDVAATILDVCGVTMPATVKGVPQEPVAGRSIAASFRDPLAAGRRVQYYEQFGCRAIYRDGWKAVAFHPLFPYLPEENPFAPFEDDVWELFHIEVDPAETDDLAAAHPALLEELVELWWSEAERHGALPLHGFRGPIGARLPTPQRADLRPFALAIPESSAPDTKRDDHHLSVDLTVADGVTPTGVLIAQGGRFGGFALHLVDGVPTYTYNFFGTEITDVAASGPLAPGRHTVVVEVRMAGGMAVSLLVDGAEVASGSVPRTIPMRFSLAGEGLCCGYDDATAVSPAYVAPNRCNATIHAAAVDVRAASPLAVDDHVRKALMSQ